MKQRSVVSCVAMLMTFTLAGCGAGTLTRRVVVMPGGEVATIIAHDQQAPDWLLDTDKRKLNFVVKGNVSQNQLAAIAAVESQCKLYVGDVHPSNIVAIGSTAVLYAIAGFGGVGLGSQALSNMLSFVDYGKYGAAATGLAGAANGIISLGGKTYTFQNCGREVLDLFPKYGIRVLQKSPW